MNLSEAMVAFAPLHVIYRNPRDYPGRVVVRAWYGSLPGPSAIVLGTVPEARQLLHDYDPSLVCIPRAPSDDACIVECWL